MKNRYLPYLLPFRCVVLQFSSAVRPKNRLFWGQFASDLSRSSEKLAVLGTVSFRPQPFVRKTGCFGDSSLQASAVRPKNRLFWGQFLSGLSRSSEKTAVLGTVLFRPQPFVRKTGCFGDSSLQALAVRPKNRLFWGHNRPNTFRLSQPTQ